MVLFYLQMHLISNAYETKSKAQWNSLLNSEEQIEEESLALMRKLFHDMKVLENNSSLNHFLGEFDRIGNINQSKDDSSIESSASTSSHLSTIKNKRWMSPFS